MNSTVQQAETMQGSMSRVGETGHWARPVSTLRVSEMPLEAVNINVEGRRPVGPLQGFGQMWQKIYRVRLAGSAVLPAEVIGVWKQHFSQLWPEGNFFHAPPTGIAPGEVALQRITVPGGLRLMTGELVLYADDTSFTFMTPQGHMFAGWITFSAAEEAGETVAQVQVLMRANDPLYEIGLILGGHKVEDRFWDHTLKALAAHFGVTGLVETCAVCVDRKRQWANAKNVWHNAAIRSSLYLLAAPVRWAASLARRS